MIYLSHFIDNNSPVYGNDDGFQAKQLKSINAGDTANTQLWQFPNHLGTHIDLPRHFYTDGRALDDFSASYFSCKNIAYIDLSSRISSGELIGPEFFSDRCLDCSTEAIIVKTGFGAYRKDDMYWKENPGFDSGLADYLRERFKNIRFIGFDSISLTSYKCRDIGKVVHKEFLKDDHPIIPIEDMNLDKLGQKSIIQNMIISPLLVNGADGTPVTVLAEVLY